MSYRAGKIYWIDFHNTIDCCLAENHNNEFKHQIKTAEEDVC